MPRHPQVMGDDHIDTHGCADEKIDEQRNDTDGTAHGGQTGMTCKPSHHNAVHCIEQHLQDVGRHQRKAEPQDLAQQRSVGHIDGKPIPHTHSFAPESRRSASSSEG